MIKKMIYLDNASTTKVDEKVVKEMEKYYLKEYGNPGSYHNLGEKALKAINDARKKFGKELGCKAEEIIFTSGSTESNNMVFFGLANSKLGGNKRKIIISAIEHSSIFSICESLKKKEGFKIVEIGVDNKGLIDLDKLEKEIDNDTLLVSVMHVNNEIGVIQDIRKIGKLCRMKSVYFHTDSAQSFGKLKIDVNDWGIDLLTASSHKINGPKGVGLLYVNKGVELEPLIYGGGQERGLRGGTENVSGIMGFSKALEIIKEKDWRKVGELRDYFIKGLEKIGGVINGDKEKRIFNNINVSFSGLDGKDLVIRLALRGIMCSTGSACESRNEENKRVLNAISLKKKEAEGSLRFSLSERSTREEIDIVLKELNRISKK